MKTKLKEDDRSFVLSQDEDMEDPVGPMMHWEGDRSREDIEFMTNWVMARKAELAKEEPKSAAKTD